jgi:hypothetical protein
MNGLNLNDTVNLLYNSKDIEKLLRQISELEYAIKSDIDAYTVQKEFILKLILEKNILEQQLQEKIKNFHLTD